MAFQVEFDTALADFVGFDRTGSFLADDGAETIFLAEESVPGVVFCVASRIGAVAGVDAPGPPGSALLMTLSFSAVAPTAGTGFQFGPPDTRLVLTCPTAGRSCSELPDAQLTWAGGTLVTSEAVPASSPWGLALLVAALLGLSALVKGSGRLRRAA